MCYVVYLRLQRIALFAASFKRCYTVVILKNAAKKILREAGMKKRRLVSKLVFEFTRPIEPETLLKLVPPWDEGVAGHWTIFSRIGEQHELQSFVRPRVEFVEEGA